MKQQTAVKWLVEELLIFGDKAFNREITLGEYHIKKNEVIEQALEMEKQQKDAALYSKAAVKSVDEKSCQTAVSGSILTEKQLRKMAKKACDGHQHAMRYGNMLNACFKMGKMMLEELERQKADC